MWSKRGQLLLWFALICESHCRSLLIGLVFRRGCQSICGLRGGALEIEGWTPAPLHKCREWLEATTFDGSPVASPFRSGWDPENVSKEVLLWMAAEMGDGRAVSNLIAAGVDINAANDGGETALHKVVQSCHEDLWCLSVLIGLGADLLAKESNGMTPLDYAKMAVKYGGPQSAVIFLEQAISMLVPRTGKELALVPSVSTEEVKNLVGDQSAWIDIHKSSPLPLSPAQFARVRNELQSQIQDSAANTTSPEDLNTKNKSKNSKKKRKRFASAKERWMNLKKKRRERAAAARGSVADSQ